MCIFVIGLFDKLKNYKFSGFSYFAKKVSGHGLCCVPFSESACNTENNDTKYAIEFRILSLRKTPWTTQSLNLAPDIEAWCTVRPFENVVWKMAAILSRPLSVKILWKVIVGDYDDHV